MSFRTLPPRAALWSVAFAGAFATSAFGQQAPAFAALVRQTQGAAPSLAVTDAEIDQARSLALQASARPNPTLDIEAENFAGTGPLEGSSETELTASVTHTLELGQKRQTRIAAAEASIRSAEARREAAVAAFAYDLAKAYIEAEGAQREVGLAEEGVRLAAEDLRVAQALVDAGKEAEVRAVQARASLQTAQASLQEARGQQTTSMAALNALTGQAYVSVEGGLLAHGQERETFARPDPLKSPDYLSAVADREVVAGRMRVEQSRARPDMSVSLGVRRLAGIDASALVGGVSVPLQLFDKNRGSIAAAQAEVRAADARVAVARINAETGIRGAVARSAAAQNRIEAIRAGEALAEEAYRLTRVGYEGGKVPLSELLTAQRALIEARHNTLEAQLERLDAEAALARLNGVIPFGDQ